MLWIQENEAKSWPQGVPILMWGQRPKVYMYCRKNLKCVYIFDLVLCLKACYGLRVGVTSKFICWSPSTQCDGIWRWSLWEVISLWEWSPHEWDQCLYKRDTRVMSFLSAMWRKQEVASASPEDDSCQNPATPAPWSWTSGMGRNKFLLFKSFSLWHFVTAAWAD